MKITMAQFEEFEKEFLFLVIANPTYRLGQAFLNEFPEIQTSMIEDGDLGAKQEYRIWSSNKREEVLDLLAWYIEQ